MDLIKPGLDLVCSELWLIQACEYRQLHAELLRVTAQASMWLSKAGYCWLLWTGAWAVHRCSTGLGAMWPCLECQAAASGQGIVYMGGVEASPDAWATYIYSAADPGVLHPYLCVFLAGLGLGPSTWTLG